MNEDILNKIYRYKEKIFSFINEAESLLNRIVLLSLVIAIIIWINLGRIIEAVVSESRIKSNIVENLEEITGKKAEVAGSIIFSTKPEPLLEIDNIKVYNDSKLTDENYFQADVIRSKPSILRAILGKVDFDDLYIENAKLNISSSGDEKDDVYRQIANIFSEKSQFYGKKLKFKNLTINLYKASPLGNNNIVVRSIFFPELELIPRPENKRAEFELKGSFVSKKLYENYFFEIDIADGFGKKTDYTGKIYSDSTELNMSGKLDTEGKVGFDGKVDGRSKGLTKKLFSLIGASDEFLGNLRDDDESSITLSYKFENDTFTIDTLKSSGKIISFTLNSKTEIRNKISSKVDMNIDRFDYSQLFKTYLELVSEKKAQRIERDFKKKLEEYFIFAVNDDINISFNLEAPSIKFFHEKSGSLSLNAILQDNHFNIKEFNLKLPGDSIFSFTCEAEINKKLKQLKGTSRVVFGGKNMDELYSSIDSSVEERKEKRFGKFYVDAKAFLYGQNIHFREIVAKIDSDALAGQILVDYSDEIKASAAFNFTSLNIDKYLFNNDKGALGVANEENTLASRFDFLRAVDSIFDKLDVSLLADNMVKAGRNFTDVSIYAQITPGITEIKDIFFDSDIMGQVKGNAHLDLSDFQPKLDLNLTIDNYDTDLLIYGEVVRQNDNYSFDSKWSSEKVAFEKLGNFIGKMNLKINELKIYHFLLNNFSMSSHAEEGKFVIDKARADLFGNKIDFTGYLTTEYPSFSLSFVASDLNSDSFMKDTFNLDQIVSIFNMSGVLASSGYSIEQMIQNLKGNISIATKGFTVNGFGVDSAAKALPLAKRREYVKLIADELLGKGEKGFGFFIGAFVIDSGHITFDDLTLTSANLKNMKVSGDIDLPKWTLNLNSSMDVVTAGNATFELKGTTSGVIPNIKTVWDTSGMMKYWEQNFFGGR